MILCATSARYEPGPLLEGFKDVNNERIEDVIQGLLPFIHSRAFVRKLRKELLKRTKRIRKCIIL